MSDLKSPNPKDLTSKEVKQLIETLSPNKKAELLDNLINDLPEKVISEVLQRFSVSIESHSGPLPSPEHLESYSIIPNGADRIMQMAENQSKHRMELEQHVVSSQIKESQRGQLFALIISVFSLCTSLILGLNGHDTVAGVIGGSTIVSLATIFIYGKKTQKKDTENQNS